MTDAQTQRQARIAGLCYLAVIAGGIFAEGVVRSRLFVAGDAAATLQAIAAHEALWRAGIAVHLAYLMFTVPMTVIICGLLAPAGRTMARMALVFSLMCSTVEAASLALNALPLMLIRDHALAAFSTGQLQALGYLAVRLFGTGFTYGILLFSGFCALTGLLIWRSRLVPRPIGLMMMLAGAGYFADGLTAILAPHTRTLLFPWLLMPGFFGETALALWLVIRGVRLPLPDASRPDLLSQAV